MERLTGIDGAKLARRHQRYVARQTAKQGGQRSIVLTSIWPAKTSFSSTAIRSKDTRSRSYECVCMSACRLHAGNPFGLHCLHHPIGMQTMRTGQSRGRERDMKTPSALKNGAEYEILATKISG